MVGGVVHALRQTFAASTYEAHVIVIDDGSSDATARVAEEAGATVIRHILNTGSGGATSTGIAYAREHGFTAAATLDADGQHHPEDVLTGLSELKKTGADLLVGSRLIHDSSEHMSPLKRFFSWGATMVTLVLFGIRVTDTQSGLRIFSERAINELRWKLEGYEFCSEMLWRAKQQGLTVAEYPIHTIYTDYSRSKGQSSWNAFNIVKTLLRQRLVELFSE